MSDDIRKSLARELAERYDKLLLKDGFDSDRVTGRETYLPGPWRRRHGGYEHVKTGQFVPLDEVAVAGPIRPKPEVKS